MGPFALVVLAVLALSNGALPPTYVGPLVCNDPSCPTQILGGPTVNNSNFHLRDISVARAGDGYYYLTGTSSSAGDRFWSDVWGVIRMWRSRTLEPGSFEPGGRVVYNITRDCTWCGNETYGCRTPNIPSVCPNSTCARVWAPEFHFLPSKVAEPSGGYYLTFHFHCAGGSSGVLASTTGLPFGPYADHLWSGVSGGDVTLFVDPADGEVYTGSSGSRIVATHLTSNLSAVVESFEISGVCSAECSHELVGFEGTQLLAVNGSYYMCASAFGNTTNHGGPKWDAGQAEAVSNVYYSTWCGVATSIQGPFLDTSGDPGGWLSVPFGGHNTYFVDENGGIYSTMWYGDLDGPPRYSPYVNLPTILGVKIVGGRLVAENPQLLATELPDP